MLIMPELAVALRRELTETTALHESEMTLLSTWSKARSSRAERLVAALRRALAAPMDLVLWQRGIWADATSVRDTIGGDLCRPEDMESVGQLWLFDAITLPPAVKKRFALPAEARLMGRLLLPAGPPEPERTEELGLDAAGADTLCGTALGYLFRTQPVPEARDGIPFLRMLPDLYPGEFLVDPHINFIAALRFLRKHGRDVTPFGRTRAGRILTVGPSDLRP